MRVFCQMALAARNPRAPSPRRSSVGQQAPPLFEFLLVDLATGEPLSEDFKRTVPVSRPVVPVRRPPAGKTQPADVVGPVCETGDILAKAVPLPHLSPDDLVAIETAGAYGAVMASTYNTRLPVAEVMVNGDEFCVIRPRPDYDALLSLDRMPPWLENSTG